MSLWNSLRHTFKSAGGLLSGALVWMLAFISAISTYYFYTNGSILLTVISVVAGTFFIVLGLGLVNYSESETRKSLA